MFLYFSNLSQPKMFLLTFLIRFHIIRRKLYVKLAQLSHVIKIPLDNKFRKNTYDFPGERNIIRIDQNFQEILSKISLEHVRFSRRKKNHKNRSNFPGELSQNFVTTHTIFQETIPPRTDILWNCLVGCFRRINTLKKLRTSKGFLQFSSFDVLI